MSDAESGGEQQQDTDWGCYRHPYDAAGVKCTRCDRPICPKCMITAPVGFQCPECVKGAPAVKRYSDIRRGGAGAQQIVVTSALIAINATIAVLSFGGGGSLNSNRFASDFALIGPAVANGDWYRLVTSGFLHYGPIHVFFNMFILFQLGQLLEPAFGRVRYALLYFAALLGGSVGALLLSSPIDRTAGASGAVFGLMAAAAIAMRARGINVMQTSIGSLLVMNLLITFVIPGVSIGGHLGGLAAGAIAGLVLLQTDDKPIVGAAAVAALAVTLFGVGLAVA